MCVQWKVPDIVERADPQSNNLCVSQTRDDDIMCCHNQCMMSHDLYDVPYISVIGLKVGQSHVCVRG